VMDPEIGPLHVDREGAIPGRLAQRIDGASEGDAGGRPDQQNKVAASDDATCADATVAAIPAAATTVDAIASRRVIDRPSARLPIRPSI